MNARDLDRKRSSPIEARVQKTFGAVDRKPHESAVAEPDIRDVAHPGMQLRHIGDELPRAYLDIV